MGPIYNKPYKVDYTRPVFPQFLQVIQVEFKSEAALWWKDQLQKQVDKHLDTNKRIAEQQVEMLRIEKELKKKYPDTFAEDEEKRLYYAIRAIAKIHKSKRAVILVRLRQKNTPSKEEDKVRKFKSVVDSNVIDLTLDDSDSELNHNPMPLISVNRNVRVSPARIGLTVQGTGIAFVFDFLSKCNPSMTFLLHILLQHGCDSENHIRAVANWSSAKREEWLAQLFDQKVPSAGRRLNKEEIRRLNNHFATYTY